VVLPDARMDLQLSLEPHQGSYISSSEGWRLQSTSWGEPQSCGNVLLRQKTLLLIEVSQQVSAPRMASAW
jgi:hypothetical protein